MNRSKWKRPYLTEKDSEAFKKLEKSYQKIVVSRDTEVLPKFIEKTFTIHNGKKYIEILITEEMIGHKFGEFSITRKRFFKKKQKTKK